MKKKEIFLTSEGYLELEQELQYLKTVKRAEETGLIEGQDFFLIKDNCLTELVPDEGSDRCFIAIGFRPMDAEKIKPVVKKLQLYK